MTGYETMIAGLILIGVALLGEIVLTFIFKATRKRTIQKIYDEK